MPDTDSSDRGKDLVPLLMEHRHGLFAYIFSVVPNRADAEDILQEVSTIIWEKFGEFEQGTNFSAWARRIAFYEIKASRSRYARSKVVFDESVYEAVAATMTEMEDEVGARHEALDHCLGKLNDRDRDMILTRYAPGQGVDEAARQSGRTKTATYKALGRLRRALFNCINRRVGIAGDNLEATS